MGTGDIDRWYDSQPPPVIGDTDLGGMDEWYSSAPTPSLTPFEEGATTTAISCSFREVLHAG